MIRILIADDHPVVREGLKQIISKASDMQVSAEATDGHEVSKLATADTCDVVLLDINLPRRDGFDVLRQLRQECPKLPVLVLSVYPEDQLGVRSLRAGAAGYMNKESAPKELISAIRKVCGGGKYVSPYLAEKLASAVSTDQHAQPHELLTDREYQVFRMIASGMTANEIADRLSLSVKTIRTYRDRLLQKMNLKNDVELTHYALNNNLVESTKE